MSSAAIPAAAEHVATADHTGDPSLESLPAEISIWEAATAGREIILDKEIHPNASEALLAQQRRWRREKVAAMAKKKTARTPYAPATMEVVSGVQPVHKGEFDEHSKVLQGVADRGTQAALHRHEACRELVAAPDASHVVARGTRDELARGRPVGRRRVHDPRALPPEPGPAHGQHAQPRPVLRDGREGAGAFRRADVQGSEGPPRAGAGLSRETVDASRAGRNPAAAELQGARPGGLGGRPSGGRQVRRRSARVRETRVLPDLGYGVPAAKHAK